MRLMQYARHLAAAMLAALLSTLAQAGALSDTLENRLIDHLLRGQSLAIGSQTAAWDAAPPVWIALGTACSDASFTELGATGSYARVRMPSSGAPTLSNAWSNTNSSSGTTASSGTGGTVYNLNAVTFPTATADWNSGSTIGYWAVYDASTSGNMLLCAALTTARAVTNGATASFAAGALSVQQDN